MEPRTRSALVIMLAVGWLVVGFTAVDAAATQETETVVVGHVAAEATTPSAVSWEQATRREPADPAGAMSLLLPGRKVRVYLLSADDDDDEAQMEGTLVDADENSLRIRDDDRVITVPRHTIRRIEVATGGRKRTDWGRLAAGAGIGVGPGLGAGWFAGFVLAGGVSGDPKADVTGKILLGGALGAGIGALIAHATQGPEWTDVPLERVHVSLLPAVGRRGFGLTLAVGF